MSVQRLYRLTVESWPTPDGLPFDRQSDEFWERISEAFYNPPGLAEDEYGWPEWMPNDADEWFDDPGGSWEPPHRAYKAGRYYEAAALVVPIVSRRHWQTRAAAERKAADLRNWGCVVRVDASDPITWGGAS